MKAKTQLLDLPNELFPFIFQYLNSADLVQAFFTIQSLRIRALIQPFISNLDISQKLDQWIETYLPDLFTQQSILSLRLQDKHITFISEYLLSSNIQSMNVINSDWTTEILNEGINHLRRYLKKLVITFTSSHGKGDIASQLFQSDSQLEHLNISGRFLYFDHTEIGTCLRLTHLSIELEGMYRVFILMEHLPNLKELKVN
jgi:hypothetical protein